jgi:glutaconate CoA-transferase subunit B
MTTERFTLEELMIARMSKEFHGEAIATGATYLGEMAARLAKVLYQPDLVIVGGGSHAAFDCDPDGHYLDGEWSATRSSRMIVGWEELFDMIAQGKLQIFVGPAQIDRFGNSNISAVGPWRKPVAQLIGARGLPDDLWGNEKFFYHVRRHSKQSFVEKVDIVCALGHGTERDDLGLKAGLPGVVVSDLGVFGWDTRSGHIRIETLHPGVTFDLVQRLTGFAWPEKDGEDFPATAPPTAEELRVIREIVDPKGWRLVESSDCPADLLRSLCEAERGRELAEFSPDIRRQ